MGNIQCIDDIPKPERPAYVHYMNEMTHFLQVMGFFHALLALILVLKAFSTVYFGRDLSRTMWMLLVSMFVLQLMACWNYFYHNSPIFYSCEHG